MARSFQCTLVTPQRQLLDQQVVYASLPAADGQIGLMPGRAPMLIKLGDGPLRLDLSQAGAQSTRWFFVGGGFAQMKDNALSLVAGEAVSLEEMVLADAQAALAQAQSQVTHTDDQFTANQRQQVRARTMLQLLQR